MAKVRSVDFLPEIFQTEPNKQFLAATLDQLIQEPKFKKTQGFIGRRIGPGVNPNDRYVVEPTKTRADYQLEPGVISLKPDTTEIQDAVTYPGILDSIEFQGGDSTRPDRLFASQYYTWDPFIDWDSFINFSQYFWLPGGPDPVAVASVGVPAIDNFVVTRENGVYTFSGISGNNPTLDLVRGGNYTFQVAQNAKETENFRVSNSGTSAYVIDYQSNPNLTLVRGNTYIFNLNLSGAYPFYIKTAPTTGLTNIYSNGVTNNGAIAGLVTFTVPQNAPNTLYYASATQSNMQGQITVIDGTPGTGPGFWIQTNPGVSGLNPVYTNISSRQVYGVTNNGEDLGTVTFNVPQKTKQDFYYGLNDIGTVDFITDLRFDQINGVQVDTDNPLTLGLGSVANVDGRTVVFKNFTSTEQGGWYERSFFDPLQQSSANNGLLGSFDSQAYDLETEVPLSQRYGIWQISIVNNNGFQYYQLNNVGSIGLLDKFTVLYSDVYANTQWYKNDAGIFIQIPVLTASLDTLYYQDGTDPEIFGRIRLIDPTQSSTLFIEEILGKKNYTSPNGVVFTNGLKVVFRGSVEPATYIDNEYYVSGVGTAIELLPVSNFITPESYVVEAGDSTQPNTPADPDYLTISRASRDLNAWTRSNRWFHIDVLNATAEYNNTEVLIDNQYRAKRPIIQFRPGLRLFNMGTEGKQPVDVIDFAETDAFSNIEGSTGYSVDGYNLVQGSRVIFAKDEDANVRNKIWVVNFVTPDSVPPLIAQPIINLTLATDGLALIDQSTLCVEGLTLKGLTFWYDGVDWVQAQQKTKIQQAPLFNVYDAQGVSFSNLAKYPSTTFEGSKLFSYAVGDTNVLDPVLQFPLQYLNINNVGDIVFDNNLYSDTFLYVRDNVSETLAISSGFAREYSSRTTYQRLIGWNTAATESLIRQQFRFTYEGQPLELDIKAQGVGIVPAVKVYVGSNFREPDSYTLATTSNTTLITLDNTFAVGDTIEVLALSDQTSKVAFYQVPINLENNPLNSNSPRFTLGTIRTHYESICENITTLAGPINGANNSRDLGNIGPYGLIILQQSAPLTLTGYFNRSKDFNIFAALTYNSREYQKFKDLMLNEVTNLFIQNETAGQVLTTAIANITAGRVESNPFYWSDMLPVGSVYTETQYTVSLISTNTFDTVQVYNYTSANYHGMNVYVNDVLLTRGFDYIVANDGPRITILSPLAVGDVVTLQEFSATYGSFVPNTPTKMGLYPAYKPRIAVVDATNGPATVIVGHDGSQTPIFGDIRDQVLLEFETRIYNNIKLDNNPVPLTGADVIPGQFRTTGYEYAEINDLLGLDFLNYIGWNKLDYISQTFNASNPFTYNYSQSENKLSPGETLLGAWRGINRYFYDSQDPNQTPWEMLGLTIKPDWWESKYGPAPYTQDNLVLWDDLEAGLVADPVAPYIAPKYVRPGLTQVIPSDSSGLLLPPLNVQVGLYNDLTWQKSWALGDGGPVEASWWNSSAYPFALMRMLALTKPAKFYTLFADRDLYKYSEEFGQYLYNNRYRLDANGIEVYGNGVSKASYINWIVDYNRQTGLNSTKDLTAALANLDVRLCYRMASFSDKQYIKLYTEKSSPNSVNTTLLIPDESYDLLLYKNQPFERVIYSSVVIQMVEGGYAVYGYSTSQPFFNILASQGVGLLKTYTTAGVTVQVPTVHTNTVVQVPYGFVFSTLASVCDFLLSYGAYLQTQGLSFTDRTNGVELTWSQMVVEFLYWSQQGWSNNALINLNPLASALEVTKPGTVADSVVSQTAENLLLDQNKQMLPTQNINIVRLENTLKLQPLTNQSLSFADIRFTNYEHMIVLNNASVFGDLIYEPITGARQSRLNFVGVTSSDWNGTFDAPGFIFNLPNIEEWSGLKKYTKGQIVKYKNQYWSAQTIVDPSPAFDFNLWVKSDYGAINQGMLPNISNKANQLQNTYSITTANLENDNDLLAFGLIGFRPRQYMAALNLDDISQVNVYSQFLGSKGTILSAELLSNANLGKEAADYQIYENWGVQRAVYGANANRSFVELRLNRALLSANPSLVQVVIPQEPSVADQQILLSNVWRQSYKLTSPDFMPTTLTEITDTALPTAGYVNFEDADITTFDLGTRSTILANIEKIKVGATVWVAKVNNYEWNVYRVVNVPGIIDHVCDNLDGTSIVNFTKPHGLVVGDTLIIKQFDSRVDGVYRVLTVEGVNRVTVAFKFVPGSQVVINGTGLGFTLKTQRVAQASDIIDLSYANNIETGNKVWVDDDGTGHWQVLEKQNQFSTVTELAPYLLGVGEKYGQSVAQANNRFAALVGSPLYDSARGGVYVYVKNYSDQYAPVSPVANGDAILTLDVAGVRGYGNAVDFGNQTWAVAGASKSLGPNSEPDVGYAAIIYRDPELGEPGVIPYAQWQLLVPPELPNTVAASEFGYSVAISNDERWVYVGAPGVNRVYAYGRVDWQDQFVRAVTDGTTTTFAINQTIQINADTQVEVTVDNVRQTLGADYTVSPGFGSVIFTSPPGIVTAGNFVVGEKYSILTVGTTDFTAIGASSNTVGVEFVATGPGSGTGTANNFSLIDISRINRKIVDGDTYFDVTGTTGGAGIGAQFTIRRVRNTLPVLGITTAGSGYVVSDTIVIPGTSFGTTTNLTITVTSVSGTGGILTFTSSWTPPALQSTFSLNEYFFTAQNIYSFSVYVDGVLYRPVLDYDFDADSSSVVDLDLTFAKPDGSPINPATYPGTGAEIIVQAKGYYEYVDSLTVAGLDADARFGHSITTTTDGRQVLIGAKNQTVSGKEDAGIVFVFDRNVQKFIYSNDTSTTAFSVLGTVTEPVSVLVNNQFFINQQNATPFAANSFTVSGNTIDIDVVDGNLEVGDIVEIETNQFALVQVISKDTVTSFTNFGQALDICSFNCSLYVGAPQDSTSGWKAGSVQRSVNQARVYGSITATVQNPVLTVGNTLRINNIDVAVPSGGLSNFAAAINNTVPNVNATVTNGYLTVAVKNFDSAPAGNKVQVLPGSVGTAFYDLGFEIFVYTQTIVSPYPVDFAEFGYSVSVDTSANNLVVGSPQGTLYLITIFDDGTTYFDEYSTSFFSIILQSGAVYTYDYLPSANSSVNNPGQFVFGLQIASNNADTYDTYGSAVSYVDGVLMIGAPGNDNTPDGSTEIYNYGRVFVFENPDRTPAWTTIRQQAPVVDISLLNSVYTYDRITSARTEQFDFFNPLQGKILGAAQQNIDYISALDPASYNTGDVNNNGTTWFAEHVGQIWWDVSTVRFIDPNQDDIVYASRRWGQVFPGSTVDIYQWVQSSVPPANYAGPGVARNVVSYTVRSRLGIDGTFDTYYYFWVRGITTVASQQGKTLPPSTIANYIENPKGSGIPYVAPVNASTIAIYNASDVIVAEDTIINIEFDRERNNDNVHVEYELIAQNKEDAFLSANLYRKLQDSFCGVDTFGNLVPDPNLGPAERYGVQFRPRQSMFVNRFEALRNYITRANAVLSQYPVVENKSLTLLNSAELEPPANQTFAAGTFTVGFTYTISSVGTTDFVAIGAASNTVGVEFVATAPGTGTGTATYSNWNLKVANLEILSFQNIDAVPLGYQYLVSSDSRNNGLWTVYTVQLGQGPLVGTRELVLTRVQNFDTRRYWSYVNWYRPGYNPSTKVIAEVPTYTALQTLTLPIGSSVKVTANAQGKFEIYLLTDIDWERVGLQDGTIEISAEIYNYQLGRFGFDVEVFDAQYFDQEPVIETRKIIQAINEELFVGDLLIERNRALTLMFNFVLSEFSAPEWLVKTSLIDVDHRIRNLEPFQNYRKDNQEFVLDYIQEVKPYHVQVREFNLRYDGLDNYAGDISDFDVPAYYNTSLVVPQFTSPILNIDDPDDPRYEQPYLHASYQQFNTLSDTSPASLIWQAWPYNQWYNNYLLTLESITVVDNGQNYTEAPTVTIVGDAEVPATAQAFLNSQGRVAFITVIDQGSGYFATPTVVFSGGNGTGARAYAVMNRVADMEFQGGRYTGLTRSFRTVIKYDRYQYATQIIAWEPGVSYEDGALVRYDDRVWRAASSDSTAVNSQTFNLEDWQLVAAKDLSGVDRTMGYYVPGVNEPGLDLPLLVDGVDYPGVQVWGDYFLGSAQIPPTVFCTATDATNNQITCASTFGLQVGYAIKFLGTTVGGIVPGQTYYILSVPDQTHFTISAAFGGFAVTLTTATGDMTAITNETLDAVYASSFADIYLGTRFSDVNVSGGQFIGPYEGHAPEELVNGSEFDTLDMRVYTRPGSDWSLFDSAAGEDGHGFQITSRRYVYSPLQLDLSWDGLVENPVHINVSNVTNAVDLVLNRDYTVDWINRTVSFLAGVSVDDVIDISVYELGGGSQLYRQNYIGNEVGNTIIVPVNSNEIWSPVLFVNGVKATVSTWEPYYPGTAWSLVSSYNKLDVVYTTGPTTYYRALQNVPAGIAITNTAYWFEFVPTTLSKITLTNTYTNTDALNLTVFGFTTPLQYSWSTPQTQNILVTSAINASKVTTLTNSLNGTNIPNAIVDIDGVRLRPYAGIEYIGDGVATNFGLPTRSGYSQAIINAPLDVTVYLNNVLQQQDIGAGGDYSVTNFTGTQDRAVVFATVPPVGARILISVSTAADYLIVGSQLQLVSPPPVGSTISVTTFNDTAQQNILTQVYQGPLTAGVAVTEPYDTTSYDPASVNATPGSYDYSAGISIPYNDFDLGRSDVDSSRLYITKNGYRLYDGQDYTVQGQLVVLASGAIAPSDIVVITQFTNSVVPEAMAFRIFQDMRGVQATFRITEATTTTLVQNVSATADVIYLKDASRLTEPDLANGVFGVCTIGGERIMYRNRNTVLNTVSGLMRGTAGTAADDHYLGQEVYDMGRGNLLSVDYQDHIDKDTTLGDGSTTIFYAPTIGSVDVGDSTGIDARALEVFVGGIRQDQYITVDAADLQPGMTYIITSLGTTDWNAVAGTTGVSYAVNDHIAVTVPGSGSGTALYRSSEYMWQCTDAVNVTIDFVINPNIYPELRAPAYGSAVTIAVRRGQSWYTPGASEPSNGIALQETDTAAARFLRGL